jgi:signal transduction histidine kinase
MKSDFIKQISHEIRTPLNVLSGFGQVLTRGGIDLDEKSRHDITQRIADNAERITQLVNKMLELSEAASQKVIDQSDRVSATLIATQTITDMSLETNSQYFFEFEVDQEAEKAVVNTNLRMASRVLSLLLDNAKKFLKSPDEIQKETSVNVPGTIKLRLSCPNSQQVAFIVEDNGIGIPEEEAERIFDEFVQLDEYFDGTGIGLTVARSIARRLGGDVVLDTSYHSKGARFVFTLPTA